MKKCVFLLVVCNLLYVRSAPTDSEMVWLKDVTKSFDTVKRTLSDLDLPDQLTFHLSRRSHDLTLQLKRNHGIDPNADVYVVRKLKDGRSLLEKTRNFEKEDVAYYQDRENGAFMTARCVKRSNGQCNRVINGNIRIGDRNYDLRPAETDVTSRNLLDVQDLLGTQYVLHYQANIQREISTDKKTELELIDLLRRSPHEQDKRHHFLPTNSTLSSRNVTGLHNRGTADKKDNVKQVYWVEVAVLIDYTVWDLYLSLVQTNDVQEEDAVAKRMIREAYSHIINGVNLRYNEIEDNSIEISVTLRQFYIFQTRYDLPVRHSRVKTKNGKTYMNVDEYYKDIAYWDEHFGSKYGIDFDHAMLFTRHDLYHHHTSNNEVNGLSFRGGVCVTGTRISIIEEGDYFDTEYTAAHELGHNLGAIHDGEEDAIDCHVEDLFIMSPEMPVFDADEPYSRNPWIFSNCSVEAFKKTLRNTTCLTNKGGYFNDEEWIKYMMKLPGEVYTLDEQCKVINGHESAFCGTKSPNICQHIECTDPREGQCMVETFSAATGTNCGTDMWCSKGRCVPKASK